MISIVMPTYNGERYIEEAITSIISQKYQDWELIIVNDCSTDKTLQIAMKYADIDKRIYVYSNDINQKLPKTLNIGFERARGDYYTWSSDDNIFKPMALGKMADILDKYEDVGFVYACEEFINENNEIVGVRKHPRDLKEIYCSNIVSACFLYRREVHEKLNGYNTNRFLVEDYDFFLKAFENYKFYYIKDVLYQYRKHNNSLTTTRREDILLRTIDLLKTYDNEHKLEGERAKIYRGITNCYIELVNIYFEKNRKLKCDLYDKRRLRLHIIKNTLQVFLRI